MLFALGFGITNSDAADKIRLYDFEEGTPGASTTSVPDKITSPVLFGDGQGMIEIPGSGVTRPLPPGNLMTVADATAVAAPDLEGFFGSSATYVDITSDQPSATFNGSTIVSNSTRALQFSGSGGFDDFTDIGGSKVVFFDEDAYNNNDPIASPGNTAESFNLLYQAWVKPNSSASGTTQRVWEATREWGVLNITSSNLWSVTGFSGGKSISTSEAVVYDDWSHVAIWRTAGGVALYVNGRVVGAVDDFFNNWSDNTTLGSGSFGVNAYTGLIDDFSISGTPLTGFNTLNDLDFYNGHTLDRSTADITQDGIVDQADYDIFALNAGFNNGVGLGDPFTYIQGDVDQNGRVDFFDFQRISREAAAAGNPLVLNGVSVPEPASVALIMVGCMGLAIRRRRVMFAVLALAFVIAPQQQVNADVVVAEDFFYKQPTKSLLSLNGFTVQSYGGGQNGTGGTWDTQWTAIAGSTIVGEDAIGNPNLEDRLEQGIHSAALSRVGSGISLQRDFEYSPSALNSQVIYFAADMKVVDVLTGRIFGEFGIASPTDDLNDPVVSFGITDGEDTVEPTFFAQLGGTQINGDAIGDPDDALVSNTFQRIVGKLEVNAVPLPLAGDFDTNGIVDGLDFLLWQRNTGVGNLADWEANYGSTAPAAERLSVYFEPTAEETSSATVLTLEADVMTGLSDSSLLPLASLNARDALNDQIKPHFIDDIAIGTTWNDVVSVSVPRLTVEVDTTTGTVTLVNDTAFDIDLAYYELLSEGGSLLDTWNSLDDQNVDSGEWTENSPSADQLIESNFTDSTTLLSSGGSLILTGAYNTVIDAQDLVARWGVKEGFDGMLNLATVVYDPVPVVTTVTPVPEPSTLAIAICALCFTARRRAHK